MERVQVLLDKLMQQRQQNASPAQLLLTVQLLHNELELLQQNTSLSTAKVAVFMPARPAVPQQTQDIESVIPATVPAPETKQAPAPLPVEAVKAPGDAQPEPVAVKEEAKPADSQRDLFGNEIYTLKRPTVTLRVEEEKAPPVQPDVPAYAIPARQAEHHPFDAMAETPTLLQQPTTLKIEREINEVVSTQQPSLNDKLKQEKKEVVQQLKDSPVKDLRKAIGINDKFLFLNELFNGDEVMYERSIKTINNFHILQEAEYWMNRELKVRLGWNDNKETVQHFYTLVRRRFS